MSYVPLHCIPVTFENTASEIPNVLTFCMFNLTIIKLNFWEFSTRNKCFQKLHAFIKIGMNFGKNWHYFIEWILVFNDLISKSYSDLLYGPKKMIWHLFSVPVHWDKTNINIKKLLWGLNKLIYMQSA